MHPNRELETIGASRDEHRPRYVGEQIFLWVAIAAAAIFWGMTMTTAAGILAAMRDRPVAFDPGAGGMGYLLMDVVGGLVILGLAIGYGAWRYHTRDKSLDPVTEAATARMYDKR